MRSVRFNYTHSILFVSFALAASLGWGAPGTGGPAGALPDSTPLKVNSGGESLGLAGLAPGETAEDVAFRTNASPVGHFVHLMQPGDTLEMISRIYGVDEARLKSLNRLSGDRVAAGVKIAIPRA